MNLNDKDKEHLEDDDFFMFLFILILHVTALEDKRIFERGGYVSLAHEIELISCFLVISFLFIADLYARSYAYFRLTVYLSLYSAV